MLKGSSKKKKIALVSIIMVSVILIILLYLTTIPTHKFNNFHTDSVGDVEDENIDIVKNNWGSGPSRKRAMVC